MNLSFKNLSLVFIGLLLCLEVASCSSYHIKLVPEYHEVDPRVQKIVKEYKELAKMNGITFKHEVTIGFKKLNMGYAVGLTTYGLGWREIDLDIGYYDYATPIAREIVVLHELGHAYCNRDHDFGTGTPYKNPNDLRIWDDPIPKTPKNGYYQEDGCPYSIMFPITLDTGCFLVHYNDYIIEMFNRCEPF
jgi:hypothetical protein